MKNAFLWFGLVAFFSTVTAKADYFSDASEDYKKLQEIVSFLQKSVQEVSDKESESEAEVQSQSSRNELNPPFQYSLPATNTESDDFQPFAVGPFDPRFYRDFGRSDESEGKTFGRFGESKEKRPSPESLKGAEGDQINEEVYEPSRSYVQQVPLTVAQVEEEKADIYFTAIVAGCSAAAVVAVVAIGYGCYKFQKNAKAAADVDYPAYGVTGPNKDVSPTSGDRRLAQSAQMYHYQHQKQQIIAMESMSNRERRSSVSDAESEEENEEGDYTVYECPGLAPTGEMEVKNPLFQDDQTPASKSAVENSLKDPPELPK